MDKSQVQILTDRYPFLIPRNVFSGEIPDDYDYTYITGTELPRGWFDLFLQMCEDIRQPLIDADYLEKFHFSQVKEKYNRLCCYHFGAPHEVCDILCKYEMMASYVCINCGKPATLKTTGYIASYCTECWEGIVRRGKYKHIFFKPFFSIETHDKTGTHIRTIHFADEWKRYITRRNSIAV